ncbi:MAG: DUF29 family protein [Xenococcaceae cyanobacterium]
MEEILDLKQLLASKNYEEAFLLVEEMEEMGKKAIADKIYSYCVILLLHLIKQEAEKRTTKSWEVSIFNAQTQIMRTNQRRKSSGYYLDEREVEEIIEDAYDLALSRASLEAFEGTYSVSELANMVERQKIIDRAKKMLQ